MEGAEGEVGGRQGWWARWRRRKAGPKKPRKFGWIIGVLVSGVHVCMCICVMCARACVCTYVRMCACVCVARVTWKVCMNHDVIRDVVQ